MVGEDWKNKGLVQEGSTTFFLFSLYLFLIFLFGTVLALWAMNRQRSGCGWFILGLIPVVNVVAAIVAMSAEGARKREDRS